MALSLPVSIAFKIILSTIALTSPFLLEGLIGDSSVICLTLSHPIA